jgi:hypothetical protein
MNRSFPVVGSINWSMHATSGSPKPGITVAISKEFLDEAALLDFFLQNTVNAFLNEVSGGYLKL